MTLSMFDDYPTPPLSPDTKVGRPVPGEQSEPTELGIDFAVRAAVGYFVHCEAMQLPDDLDDAESIGAIFVYCGIDQSEEAAPLSNEPTLSERANFVLGSLQKILQQRGVEVQEEPDGATIAAQFTRLELQNIHAA